jgi:hypothetical protein
MAKTNRNHVRKSTKKSSRFNNINKQYIPNTGAMLMHDRKNAGKGAKDLQNKLRLAKFMHQLNYAYMRKSDRQNES